MRVWGSPYLGWESRDVDLGILFPGMEEPGCGFGSPIPRADPTRPGLPHRPPRGRRRRVTPKHLRKSIPWVWGAGNPLVGMEKELEGRAGQRSLYQPPAAESSEALLGKSSLPTAAGFAGNRGNVNGNKSLKGQKTGGRRRSRREFPAVARSE